MPEVTVIVPAYNAEKTIAKTVESVLRQTFTDFELIIVDDGSTDQTLEILGSMQDCRLKVLTFPNAGVVESRNRGIRHAKGDFLTFLDSDDLWTENKLTDQIKALKANPEAAVAYSWVDYINVQDQFVHHGWHPTHQGDIYEELFLYCFIENGSNILVRREAVAAIGEFDAAATYAEDWDFYLRLAEKFDFVCVPKVHVLYRIMPNSRSSKVRKLERAGLFVLNKALKQSPERLKKLRGKSLADFYSFLFYKAFKEASNRSEWLLTLEVFLKGLRSSPQLFNAVAKRRIGRVVYGVVANR